MLEDQVLHQVVLGNALVAYWAIMAVGFSVALEGHTSFGCSEASNRSQKRGHEHQPEENQTASKPSKEA